MRFLSCSLMLLFLVISTSTAAIRIGPKIGVSFANLDMEVPNQVISTEQDVRIGFIAGSFAEIPLPIGRSTMLRTELVYTQKGTKHKIFGDEFNVALDELVLAPFVIFGFQLQAVKPFLEAGPEVGLNLVDKHTNGGKSYDSNGEWKHVNIGVNVGAGLQWCMGKRDFHLDARYNLGLSDMGDWAGTGSGLKTRTNGIQILFGLALA